jgi:membrane associated rhomboid family serine protease
MVLAQLGPLTFQNYGPRRFWLLVFITGAAGGLLSALPFVYGSAPHNSVGFSAVLFGFLGANYVYLRRNGYYSAAQRFKMYMIWGNVILIVVTMLGLMRIDNLAHIGGMTAGLGLGFLFGSRLYNFINPVWETVVNVLFLLVWLIGLWRVFLLIDGRFGA